MNFIRELDEEAYIALIDWLLEHRADWIYPRFGEPVKECSIQVAEALGQLVNIAIKERGGKPLPSLAESIDRQEVEDSWITGMVNVEMNK